jgi:hypothetical protein
MKKLMIIFFEIFVLSSSGFAQKVDTAYVKRHPNSSMAAIQAYVFLAQRSKMYGSGLTSYRYTDPCNSSIQLGLCEGWQGNFFVQAKNNYSNETSVEYIKLEQVHHAVIKMECGTQYLYVYPSPGVYFERRTWKTDRSDDGYKTDNVYWIKLYIDWTQEDNLINKFKLAFDLWGKFNNKEFNDTEKF